MMLICGHLLLVDALHIIYSNRDKIQIYMYECPPWKSVEQGIYWNGASLERATLGWDASGKGVVSGYWRGRPGNQAGSSLESGGVVSGIRQGRLGKWWTQEQEYSGTGSTTSGKRSYIII